VAKRKASAPDPVAWAKTTRPRVGGVSCGLCGNPEAVRAIKAWVPLWRAGKIGVTITQAGDYLHEHTAWKGSSGTLRRCLREHHGYAPGG
jgi:hypothetical protein